MEFYCTENDWHSYIQSHINITDTMRKARHKSNYQKNQVDGYLSLVKGDSRGLLGCYSFVLLGMGGSYRVICNKKLSCMYFSIGVFYFTIFKKFRRKQERN